MSNSNMNLCRGNCILCTNCNKIISPSDATSITKQLPHILEGLIDGQNLASVNLETLKICPSCLQDILFILEHKPHIKDYAENPNKCSVCLSDNNLVSVSDWNQFDKLIENILGVEKKKCYIICLKCIKYLEVLHRIKTNFIIKNPQLALKASPKKKNSIVSTTNSYSTPNQKRLSTNYHNNKANHGGDLKEALRHLKPLQLLNLDLNLVQEDEKLMNQIAFVKLQSLKAAYKHRKLINGMSHNCSPLSVNKESKHHSFFKIKLKMTPSWKTKKITKTPRKKIQQSTLKPEFSSKALTVNLVNLDLTKLTLEQSFNTTNGSKVTSTPTKASLKLIEEPLSSSKKRKSVTFAPHLNEVLDEVSKKENSTQSPVKSLLKRSSDLLERSESAKEENGLVSKKQKIDNSDNYADSDEDDNNRVDPFTEHLKNNSDSIFESLKSNGVQNNIVSENTIVDKDNDSDPGSETKENGSNNEDIDISEQNNAEEKSESSTQTAKDSIQVEGDISNDLGDNKSDDVSETNRVEMQPSTEDESSKNELADDLQNNQENSEDLANTRKRKLSDDLSVSLQLDDTVEPEAKKLKLEENVDRNSTEPEDEQKSENVDRNSTQPEDEQKSEDVVNKEVTATITLNSQEDTGNENGNSIAVSETKLDK